MDTPKPTDFVVDAAIVPVEPAPALSPIAKAVVEAFITKTEINHDPKISVNRFVSEIASWYEKLRNVMEIQDEGVILKNAIKRILKRRMMLGGTGNNIAEPLLRELVWARYFPDESLPQNLVTKTTHIINLHLALKHKILELHRFSDSTLNEWMLDLMSCEISRMLAPNKEKETMSNFMYHILKERVVIEDDTEDTKNVQVYLTIRRAFAKDDLSFLRFHLFTQIFSPLTTENVESIAQVFLKGFKEMERQLHYRLKEKIFLYVKRQTPIFIILDDILRAHKKDAMTLLADSVALEKAVVEDCEKRYKEISSKVRTAIIRSVIFLILTKVFFAFAIEGSYDNFVYGHIIIKELAINIIAPPLLMVIVSFFIKTPKQDNSIRILNKIKAVLYDEQPRLASVLTLTVDPKKSRSLTNTIFAFLWLAAFGLSFGALAWVLTKLDFNFVSQGVFIFFITIVSFLAYRITVTAHAYNVDAGQSLFTPFIDLLFLPVIKVGMKLTDGISQVNIFIFIFDFLIEAPFKVIFGFIEQLFVYLHTKREDLE